MTLLVLFAAYFLLQVLGDVGALADHLADEGAGELRGRLGNANLAALLAGSVYRCVLCVTVATAGDCIGDMSVMPG
jgi:hypothetical protein